MDDQRADRMRSDGMKFVIVSRLFTCGVFVYGAVLMFSEGDTEFGLLCIALTAIVLWNTWERFRHPPEENNSRGNDDSTRMAFTIKWAFAGALILILDVVMTIIDGISHIRLWAIAAASCFFLRAWDFYKYKKEFPTP
jgi:FtsH-binding integral membrane protein